MGRGSEEGEGELLPFQDTPCGFRVSSRPSSTITVQKLHAKSPRPDPHRGIPFLDISATETGRCDVRPCYRPTRGQLIVNLNYPPSLVL